jgi:riboflavin synthase
MFTGIVQEMGELKERTAAGQALRLTFKAPHVAERLSVGDSVAVNGVCLTAEKVTPLGYSACAVPETLSKTNLGALRSGEAVNLETALTPSTPIGGHFVLGHVDGQGELVALLDRGQEGREFKVRIHPQHIRYCVAKGSIALSGVSLTIAAIEEGLLRFAIIPHTLEVTTLGTLRPGAPLNYEVDILAKHVERLVEGSAQTASRYPSAALPGLTPASLGEWGYGV